MLVVHAEDGMDEISIGAPTQVAELHHGTIKTYTLTPEQFGFKRTDIKALAVASATESLSVINSVLTNHAGAARDIVALNAGAAIYACGVAPSLDAGVKKALAVLTSGAALEKMHALAALSQRLQQGKSVA